MIRETPFIVVDTETTGAIAAQDRVIEIGATKVVNNRIVDRYHALLNPERFIPYNVIQIHNITDDMVIDAPLFHQIVPDFIKFLGDDYVFVGHNVEFDLSFINHELQRIHHPIIQKQTLCTLKMSRKIFPHLSKYNLRSIATTLQLPIETSHRALEDSMTTAHLLIRIFQELEKEGKIAMKDIQLKPLQKELTMQLF